jgi:hypothetical protein
MNASVKNRVAALCRPRIVALLAALVLVALAASGWAGTSGTWQGAGIGGHYNLEPLW